MVRPYTFPPRTDGQVPHDTWWQALQDAVADIDANGPNAVATATLGSGTADASTVLYGDRVFRTAPTGGGGSGAQTGLVVAGANAPAAVRASTPYVCDGVADEAQFNAAIASLPANNGTVSSYSNVTQGAGEITFVGQLFLSAPIVANLDHVTIRGVGGSSILTPSSGFVGSSLISVNRDTQLRPCYFVTLADFRMFGNNKITNSTGGTIRGLDAMVVQSRIRNVTAYLMSGDGMQVRGNLSPRWAGNSNVIDSCYAYKNGGVGFRSLDYGEDNRMTNCEFRENESHGMWINTSSWVLSDIFNWGNRGNGLFISGGVARVAATNLKLEQNAGGLYIGVSGAGTLPSELIFSNGQFGSNGYSSLDSGSPPATHFDDVQIVGTGGAPTGVYFDKCLWDGPYSETARYALNVINGDRVRVQGGRIFPTASYVTAQVNIPTLNGTNVQFRDVFGYNYQGPVTVTVGGSPLTITAGFTPEVVYVRGGTVSSITKGGNQIAGATEVAVSLEPGEAIVVTYSSAPTIWRDRK